jgi:3-oxoadipate enol-lactonase
MQSARLDGVELEYEEAGSGEPLLLIHGGFIAADSYTAMAAEPSLAQGYRSIRYNRRGYVGSSRATPPFTIGQQAADARALLQYLGIPRAHVVGHSYGGAIALQLSLDAPDLVGSLALLEPAVIASTPSAGSFQGEIGPIFSKYQRGDREGAVGAFCEYVLGPEYRKLLEKFLLPGAFEQAVADCDTPFGVELEALQQWSFSAEDAARIRQPVLSVVGEESGPLFEDVHSLVLRWIPHAEKLTVPQANHGLQYVNPGGVANGLADFLGRHHL